MSRYASLDAFLDRFRLEFEPALESLLQRKVERFRSIDVMGAALVEVVSNFSRGGGKRIRPALVALGYELQTGPYPSAILQPAIAVELLHNFFLIHDDIMDRSPVRRHQPTVHQVFTGQYRQVLAGRPSVDQEHFGESLALLAGDLCCAIAYEALSTSDFPSDRLLASINLMHEMIDATVVGQALDLVSPVLAVVSENDVLTIHRLKTAVYSFSAPLRMGLVLAGLSSEETRWIDDYAIPVGIAFQIQDDILGLFGSEAELGKPVTSDIEEGKQTLLLVWARDQGTAEQRARLDALVGKPALTPHALVEVQTIVRETGALASSQELARGLVQRAQSALTERAMPDATTRVLVELASFVADRTV